MKSTDRFKSTIQKYLEDRAASDELFAVTFAKENKNIDDCVTYILNQVKASGCNGFDDSEIFGMAVHYYDEDDINIGAKINCDVKVNHQVKLTDEEIAEAKQKAIDDVINEQRNAMLNKKKSVKKVPVVQQSELKIESGDNFRLF